MLNFWRLFSKVVAWIDLGFTFLQLGVVIYTLKLVRSPGSSIEKDPAFNSMSEEDQKEILLVLAITWLLLAGIIFIFSIVQLGAIEKLMRATKQGKNPNETYKLARAYFIVAAVCFVFAGIGALALAISNLFWVAVYARGIFLYVAYKFKTELGIEAENSLPTPTTV